MATRISIAFHIVRVVLVILLAIIFLISIIYFIRTIDAIGDDVDQARETHWGHEVEESPLFVGRGKSRFDPYEYEGENSNDNDEEEESSPKGRLILGKQHHHYGVTKSKSKQHHIVSLIVWVVLTLFASILSLAGIIGALCLNPCMVLFSACMILVHAIFSHVLPLFHIQLPSLTSNWFLLALETPTIVLAIAFIALHRARQKQTVSRMRQRNILY